MSGERAVVRPPSTSAPSEPGHERGLAVECRQLERLDRWHAARPGALGGRVGAVGVDRPAAADLQVVVERPAVGGRLADRAVRAVGLLHQVQDGVPVDATSARRSSRRAGTSASGRQRVVVGTRVHLEGEREDALRAVHPVDLVAVGDVEVARLLGLVAVGGGHRLGHGHERPVIDDGHVRRNVRVGVAVGPEDQVARRVEGDVGADLLHAVDHAAQHEVADGARLWR